METATDSQRNGSIGMVPPFHRLTETEEVVSEQDFRLDRL